MNIKLCFVEENFVFYLEFLTFQLFCQFRGKGRTVGTSTVPRTVRAVRWRLILLVMDYIRIYVASYTRDKI